MNAVLLSLAIGVTFGACASSLPGRNGADGLSYVRVAPGVFMMGCVPSDGACDAIEHARHEVRLTRPFWIATTETTVEAYASSRRLAAGLQLRADAAQQFVTKKNGVGS